MVVPSCTQVNVGHEKPETIHLPCETQNVGHQRATQIHSVLTRLGLEGASTYSLELFNMTSYTPRKPKNRQCRIMFRLSG